MQKLTVPIETGGVIRQGTNYTKQPDGSVVAVAGSSQTPEVNSPLQAPSPTATPTPEPERPRTLLEQFHPQLGPDKEITFDEKTGRIRIAPKMMQDAEPEPTEVPDTEELPPLGEQHETIVDAVTQAPPAQQSNENQELKSQIGQLTQLVTLMAQAQMQGKPLAEVLGQQQQPKEPDYSQYDDLYDPDQRAAFIRQLKQDVKAEVMREHQPTLEQARRRQEYDAVAAQYSADANFDKKVIGAIKLVQSTPSLTIPQAYEIISQVAPATPSQSTATTPIPAANQPRTLTPEQAEAKAAQARKLPANKGVRGAGPSEAPEHVRRAGLGQLIAWHSQQATLGH